MGFRVHDKRGGGGGGTCYVDRSTRFLIAASVIASIVRTREFRRHGFTVPAVCEEKQDIDYWLDFLLLLTALVLR